MQSILKKLMGISGQLFRVFFGIVFILLTLIIIFSIGYILIFLFSTFLSAFKLSFFLQNDIYLNYSRILLDYFFQTILVLLLSKELFFLLKIVEQIYQNFIFRILELYFLHYDNIFFNRQWFNFMKHNPRILKNKQIKYKSDSVDFFLRKVFNLDFQHYEYRRRVYGLLKGRKIRRTISVKRYFFDIFGGNVKVESNIRATNKLLVETLKRKKERKSVLELYIGYFQKKRPFVTGIAGDWFTSQKIMTMDKQLAWYYLSMVGTTPFKLLVNSLLFYDIPFILRFSFIFFVFIIFAFKFFCFFFWGGIVMLFKFFNFFFLFNLSCIKILVGYGFFFLIDVIICLFFLAFLSWIYRNVWSFIFKNWFFLAYFQRNIVLISLPKQTFIFLCSYAFDKIKLVDFNRLLQNNARRHFLFSNLFQNYKYYKKLKKKRDLTYKEIVRSPWRRLKIRQRRKRGLRHMDYFKNINNILNILFRLDYFKYNKGITRTPNWRRRSFLRVGFGRVIKNKNFRDFLEPFTFFKIMQNYLRVNYLYSLQYRVGINFFFFKELDLKLKIDPLNLFHFFSLIEFMFKKPFLVVYSKSVSIVSITFFFDAIYRLYTAYISFLYNLQIVEFIKPTALIYEKFLHEPFLSTEILSEEFLNSRLKNIIQSNLLCNETFICNSKKNYIYILLVDSFLRGESGIEKNINCNFIMLFFFYEIRKNKKLRG